MNAIVKPLTRDGLLGWDQYGQLWRWKVEGERRVGTIIADVREKICCVCGRGWELTAEGMGDQYFWSNRAEWAHETCYIRHLALDEFDFWCSALVGAGFIFGQKDTTKPLGEGGPALEALPNGYWGEKDPWGAGMPWYRARLLKKLESRENAPLGRTLKLGHRKRVYHLEIEVGFGPYDKALAEELFKSEAVTKVIGDDTMLVHAWGQEKAREYLKHFARILGVGKR